MRVQRELKDCDFEFEEEEDAREPKTLLTRTLKLCSMVVGLKFKNWEGKGFGF